MVDKLAFEASASLSIGVELEWQIVDAHSGVLKNQMCEILAEVETQGLYCQQQIKPEIVQNTLEINSQVHTGAEPLSIELYQMRDSLLQLLAPMGLRLVGGGVHPVDSWQQGHIYPSARYRHLSEQYGFLTQRFTTFGQHIHIGCNSADDAIYLTQALARYIPHFIALSAASPFYMSEDSGFDSCRLNISDVFPLTGVMPLLKDWQAFCAYFHALSQQGLVESMKDFHWDIRPKPEFGTVEIRVCDTPLHIDKAVCLAAYAQTLAAFLLDQRLTWGTDWYLPYVYNRFEAARYGLDGDIAVAGNKIKIGQDILLSLRDLAPYATHLGTLPYLQILRQNCLQGVNDARYLREIYQRTGSLTQVLQSMIRNWQGLGRAWHPDYKKQVALS